jgi:hypothetical protein
MKAVEVLSGHNSEFYLTAFYGLAKIAGSGYSYIPTPKDEDFRNSRSWSIHSINGTLLENRIE